jgi:hypothetical protein
VTTIGDVTLVPWLVGDEWKSMRNVKSKYVFGHFELPLFYMNAMVKMPDHGELRSDDFVSPEYVFSGHFHKRQKKDNIYYIGNAFPHNYSDAWDDDRGMMILEWGGEPKFINWPDAPKYRTINLSELIDRKDEIIKSKMYLRVNLDIDISFEEANFIKETFTKEYDIREISLTQDRSSLDSTVDTAPDTKFESVDQIITSSISSIESNEFSQKTLIDIYNNLHVG